MSVQDENRTPNHEPALLQSRVFVSVRTFGFSEFVRFGEILGNGKTTPRFPQVWEISLRFW